MCLLDFCKSTKSICIIPTLVIVYIYSSIDEFLIQNDRLVHVIHISSFISFFSDTTIGDSLFLQTILSELCSNSIERLGSKKNEWLFFVNVLRKSCVFFEIVVLKKKANFLCITYTFFPLHTQVTHFFSRHDSCICTHEYAFVNV